jgi:hypothetical protein
MLLILDKNNFSFALVSVYMNSVLQCIMHFFSFRLNEGTHLNAALVLPEPAQLKDEQVSSIYRISQIDF